MTQAARESGRVVAIRGAVVDVALAEGQLPRIDEALTIDWDRGQITTEIIELAGDAIGSSRSGR